MALPFSESAFLDLFGRYNQALWPLVAGAWLVSLAVVIRAWRDPRAGASVLVLLAGHWLWSGVVYHWFYFRTINPAAVPAPQEVAAGCIVRSRCGSAKRQT